MSSSLNVQLTDELRRYVDTRASDDDVYATPSEYIRELIRRDIRAKEIVDGVIRGLRQIRAGEFVDDSIMDIVHSITRA